MLEIFSKEPFNNSCNWCKALRTSCGRAVMSCSIKCKLLIKVKISVIVPNDVPWVNEPKMLKMFPVFCPDGNKFKILDKSLVFFLVGAANEKLAIPNIKNKVNILFIFYFF